MLHKKLTFEEQKEILAELFDFHLKTIWEAESSLIDYGRETVIIYDEDREEFYS